MQHIVHLFVGDDLTSFRDSFAAEFRRLHPEVEKSLFAAVTVTPVETEAERFAFRPDKDGDPDDSAELSLSAGDCSSRNYFEDMYRRKVTVAHPGNRSLVVVIWAKLYGETIAPTIEQLIAGAAGCDSNVIVEVAAFTHDAVTCFIPDPLQRLSPDAYREAFRANIEALRPLRPALAALRLIANRNMDNVSLDLDEEAMARVCAEYSALMCEHYLTLHHAVVDSREYPFETFGISSILFDVEYFRSYIRGRVIIDRLRRQGIDSKSFNINALAGRSNPVLKQVLDKIRDFYNTRAAHARASLALQGSDSASNIVGTVDSEIKSIIEELRLDIGRLLSFGQISIFESEALMALILGDDSPMFDSSAVSADEVTLEDIIDDSASFFYNLDSGHEKLAEVSLSDIKKLRESMRNIMVANRRRADRLSMIDSTPADDASRSRHIDGNEYRFEGTGYKLGLDIDTEPLAQTFEPGQAGADSIDLRDMFAPVRDQGTQGSCASFAVASVIEAMRRDSTRRSPAFLYWNAREVAGNADSDCGASLYEIIRAASDKGACTEEKMPYNPDMYALAPSADASHDASLCKVIEAKTVIPRLKDIKSAIAQGFPVIVAARIFDSFSDTEKGFVRHPSAKDLAANDDSARHCNHALVVCGYSDKDRVFVVRNSWGTRFGDNGYCYIPYSYARKYFIQACVITQVTSAAGSVTPAHSSHTFNFNLADKGLEAAVLRNLIEEDRQELDSLTGEYGLLKIDWTQNIAALCNANIQAEIVARRQDALDERVSAENARIAELQNTKNDKLRAYKILYIKWLVSTGAFCLASWGCVALARTELWTWIVAALATLLFCGLFGAFSFHWRRHRQNLRDEILKHAGRVDSLRLEKASLDVKAHIHGTVLRDVEDFRLSLFSDYQTLREFNQAWINLYDRTVEDTRSMSPIVPYPFLAVLDNNLLDSYYTAWKEKMEKSIDFKSVYSAFANREDLGKIIEENETLNAAILRGLRNFSMKEYVTRQHPGKWQFLPDTAKVSEVIPDLDARATPFCPYDPEGDEAVEKYIFVKDITRDDMNGILPYFSQAPLSVASNDPYSISILNVVRYNLP